MNFASSGALQRPLAFVASFALALLLAGCEQQRAGPLRLGTNVWPGYEPFFLAREHGLVDPKRLHLVELTSASQVIQALRNDLIDGAAVTLDEALLLTSTGEDVAIVLVTDISSGADVILSHQGVSSLKALEGKSIGFEATALGAYMLVRASQLHGLELPNVVPVNVKINDHARAFMANEVDAIITFEPVASTLLERGAVKLFDSAEIPGEIVDVVVVKRERLGEAANLEHLVSIWGSALALMEAQPEQAFATIGKRLGLDTADTRKVYDKVTLPSPTESQAMLAAQGDSSLRATTMRLNDTMVNYQLLPSRVNIDRLFDASAVQPPSPGD